MAHVDSEFPMLNTYRAVVSAYSDFLTVAIHTILYERDIYPRTSFLKARKYSYPVRQSRHPKVCKWIQDAVAAVEAEMLKCTIASTSLILISPASKPLERYVFSTAAFPRIPTSEHLAPFAHPPTTLPEQFRATLARLTSTLPSLSPLPANSTFTLTVELREDEGVEPPVGREEDKRWIVAEPGWQRGREREEDSVEGGEERVGEESGVGKFRGGVRTTAVRSLEAGGFKMEVWVEEGRGKFGARVEEGSEDEGHRGDMGEEEL